MKNLQSQALLATVCVLAISGIGGQVLRLSADDVTPSISPDEEPAIIFPTTNSEHEEVPSVSSINWNGTVDFLLNDTNDKTLAKGHDEVPIKNIDEKFRHKLGFITLKGEFTARDGRVKGLSTLYRTGDVTVVKNGTSFTMTCPVGLRSVLVSYDHYRIKITRGPSMSGQIEGRIGSNSIQVKATIDVTDEGCSIRLDEVKVTEMSGLEVNVRGLGRPLDFLISKISTWLTNVFKSDVTRNLERALTNDLAKGLARTRCEKYASYFIFVSPK